MKKNKTDELLLFLKEEPEDPFIKYALALEYIKNNNFHEAFFYLNTLLESQPGYLAAYYQLGKVLERLSRCEEAICIYEKGMEIALAQNKKHTHSELHQAYQLASGIEDDDL
jgi:tetratricopeptide (TPR) repeat protein